MLSHRQNSRALRGRRCASSGKAQSSERVNFIKNTLISSLAMRRRGTPVLTS
jgi:hypothetical protein